MLQLWLLKAIDLGSQGGGRYKMKHQGYHLSLHHEIVLFDQEVNLKVDGQPRDVKCFDEG